MKLRELVYLMKMIGMTICEFLLSVTKLLNIEYVGLISDGMDSISIITTDFNFCYYEVGQY